MILKKLWNLSGLILLGLFFAWSALWIVRVSTADTVIAEDGRKTIRFVHSMAEEGLNDVLRELAGEYEQLHPDVEIVVQSIPKRAYLQWVNVQLLGQTAPDIIETLNRAEQMWEMLATRYFLPLTQYVNEPNPYNAQNDLADTIWRNTYIDGMNGGYWFHLMEYYSVPMTTDLSRMFYNKELMREITGSDQPPKNFQQWMVLCDKVNQYAAETQKPLVPIATANYGGNDMYGFFGRYFPTMTAGMIDDYDRGYTAIPDATFILFGLYKDSFTLQNQRFKTAFELIREIAENFQPGFQSALPSQARFLFVQNKALMIKGSVRDLRIFKESCNFEIGVFDFPLPEKDNPKYGKYIEGPIFEPPTGRFHFGVTKQSKHKQEAVDFLRFLTSRENNARFNEKLMWYPVIEGAQSHPFLRTFKPHPEGVYRYPLLWQGGGVKLWFDQNYPRYLSGELSFSQFMSEYEKVWTSVGIRDFIRRDTMYEQMSLQGEFSWAVARGKKLFEEAGTLEKGSVVGYCDEYQLSAEVVHMFQHAISTRRLIWSQVEKQKQQMKKPTEGAVREE